MLHLGHFQYQHPNMPVQQVKKQAHRTARVRHPSADLKA